MPDYRLYTAEAEDGTHGWLVVTIEDGQITHAAFDPLPDPEPVIEEEATEADDDG